MAKSCPFTSGKATVEYEDGTIVEKDPSRDDNVFYLDEPLAYTINYNNNETHTKRSIKGLAVTVYDPSKKSTTLLTGPNGSVDIPLTTAGKYFVSYYDEYQKKVITVMFDVKPVAAKPPVPVITPPIVVPIQPPVVTPKPQGDDFVIETGPEPPKPKNWLLSLLQALQSIFKRK